LQKIINKILSVFNTNFSRNIFKVFSGSAIAYLIGFLSLPVITRLYSAGEVGTYQLLLSIIVLFSTISGLKFELAIVLPKEDKEAQDVAVVTLLSVIATTVIYAVIFLTSGGYILELLKKTELSNLTGLIILGIFFNGLYLSMQYLYIRHKKFGGLAKNRIVEAGATGGGAILLGFFKFDFMGLFISKITGVIAGTLLILKNSGLDVFRQTSLRDVKNVLVKYKKFPLVNTPMTLLNTLSLELPVFMMSIFFDIRVIGLYTLARRVLYLPLSMVGKAFAQVYYQNATEAYQVSSKELIAVFLKTVKNLALIGLIPVIFGVVAPQAFALIFGEDWREGGVYLQLMIFWLYFHFINFPVANTFTIIDKQEIGLGIIIVSLVLRLSAMYYFSDDPFTMILALSIATGLFYIVYIYTIYFSLKKLQ
jgi:O-antigen/teichoic acid export membrane protein